MCDLLAVPLEVVLFMLPLNVCSCMLWDVNAFVQFPQTQVFLMQVTALGCQRSTPLKRSQLERVLHSLTSLQSQATLQRGSQRS